MVLIQFIVTLVPIQSIPNVLILYVQSILGSFYSICAFVVIVYRNGYVSSANILILWFSSLSVFGHSLVLTRYVKRKRHEKVFWFKCGAYILIIYYVNLG